ncbi:MAG: class I SAM-dependent DNA methyltransferase [Christensenellaceae bacterium]
MRAYKTLATAYDMLMADVDYDAWAAYLQKLIKKNMPGAKKIADVGCGTGSITTRLYALGYETVGVDFSGEMLMIAAEKARQAGERIIFMEQDIRALNLPGQDVIVAACDVANYLSVAELELFFTQARSILKEEGLLLFDISSKSKLLSMDGALFYEDYDALTYFWQNEVNAEKSKIKMELSFFFSQDAEKALYYREDEIQTQHIHDVEDVLQLLLRQGYQAKAYAFGTMDAPKAGAERIQFIAKKVSE